MCFDPVSATARFLRAERGAIAAAAGAAPTTMTSAPPAMRGANAVLLRLRGASARDRECEERAEREAEQRRCEEMAAARAEARENRGCDCVRPASASAHCTSDVLRPAATCWSRPISSCR